MWKSSMHQLVLLLLQFIILIVKTAKGNGNGQLYVVGSEDAMNLAGLHSNKHDTDKSISSTRIPKGFSASTNSDLTDYHNSVNTIGIWNMTKNVLDKKNLLSAKIKQENKTSKVEVEKRNTGLSNHRRPSESLKNTMIVRPEYRPSDFSNGKYKTKKTYNHGGGAYDEDTFYDEGSYDVRPVYEGDSYSNFQDDYVVNQQNPAQYQTSYNSPYYGTSPVYSNPYAYYGPETSYGSVTACRCPSQSETARKRPITIVKNRYPECPDQMAEFVSLMGSLGGNAWSLMRLIGISALPLLIPILLLGLLIVPLKILKFLALIKLAFKIFVLLPFIWKVILPALSHLNLHHIFHKLPRPHSDESREEAVSTPRFLTNDFKDFNSSIIRDNILACSNEAACELGSYLSKSTNDHFPQSLTNYLTYSAKEAELLRMNSDGKGSITDETIAAFTIALGRKWKKEDCLIYNCKFIH